MTYIILFVFQHGQVLESRIVPNDTREHVCLAIESILDTPGRNVTVEVIYTDDFMKDHLILANLFKKRKLKVNPSHQVASVI